MKQINFLPLGTIVILKGTTKKVMIVQRGMNVEQNDGVHLFEYGAILYPEGEIDDQKVYFNEDEILKVVFEGYHDEDDEIITKELNQAINAIDSPTHQPIEVDGSLDDDPFADLSKEITEGEKHE